VFFRRQILRFVLLPKQLPAIRDESKLSTNAFWLFHYGRSKFAMRQDQTLQSLILTHSKFLKAVL